MHNLWSCSRKLCPFLPCRLHLQLQYFFRFSIKYILEHFCRLYIFFTVQLSSDFTFRQKSKVLTMQKEVTVKKCKFSKFNTVLKPTLSQYRKCALFHWQTQIKSPPLYLITVFSIFKCPRKCTQFIIKFSPIFSLVENARMCVCGKMTS